MTGPMSPSSERDGMVARHPIVTLVIVASVVLSAFLWWTQTHPSHGELGQKVSALGAELLAELDSYDPVESAEGSLSEEHTSTLSIEDDPSWFYSGYATFTVETRDGDHKAPQEAFDAFRQHLIDTGWRENGEDNVGRMWFTRSGGLAVAVSPPDGDEIASGNQSPDPTARIFFSITST